MSTPRTPEDEIMELRRLNATLLAALETMLERFEGVGWGHTHQVACDKARLAIALALQTIARTDRTHE